MATHIFAAGSLHALSRGLVLVRCLHNQNVAGLSLIAQEMYLISYAMRYLDLLAIVVGLTDTLVKVLHLALALTIVLLMRYGPTVHTTYEAELDVTPRALILCPPFLLALLYHRYMMIVEIFHQFSLYLEPLALIPQFVLLAKRPSYPPWVLVFVILAGAESLAKGWPVLMDSSAAIHSPYEWYSLWVLITVLALGFMTLGVQAVARKRSAALNESVNKPAFGEEWDGSKFTFASDPSHAASQAQVVHIGPEPPQR